MWRVLFYIAVLVTVSKASPQYTNDFPFEYETDVNLFDKIVSLRNRYSLVLSNLIARIFLGQPKKEIKWERPKSCPSCRCGELGTTEKIIGGIEVTYAHKYPWMALLLVKGNFKCGASLINDKYVLTAAHCTKAFKVSDYKVRLSVHDRSTDIFQEYNVNRIIRHEDYFLDDYFVVNDIALIRLDTDGVKINRDVYPVCMPKKGLSYANAVGVAAGWGMMDRGDNIVPVKVLREVELYIFSNRDCMSYYPHALTQDMVCAGRTDEGKNTCKGDSGGPLTVANGSAHYLVGITSFGKDGCRKPPSVYTRVSEYLDWIKANTKDACPCNNN